MKDIFARAEGNWLTPPEKEPETVYECCLCGEAICAGEEYLDTGEGVLCPDCLDAVTIREFATAVLKMTTNIAYTD